MRKIILQMMMSLDGFIADPAGKLDWIARDNSMDKAHAALAKGADAALMGQHLYQDLAGFWPAVAASPDADEAAFAKQMNDMKKLVFATQPDETAWTNAELLMVQSETEMLEKTRGLKEQPGNYLLLYGGVQTAQTLLRHGLVDELHLDVCPVTLGDGMRLFIDPAELQLTGATPYPSGAVELVYTYRAKQPEPAAVPAPSQTAQSGEDVEYGSWAKILVVEDNAPLADIYKTHMEMIGYICYVAHEGNEALAMIEKERPSLVLLDLMVPGVAGDQILKRMRASEWGKDIKVLVISNLNEDDAPAGLRSQGIEGYAVKANLTDDQLDQMVNDILKHNDPGAAAKPVKV